MNLGAYPDPAREKHLPDRPSAAVEAGRDPAEIIDVYNFGGRITVEPISATRDEDGRWVGGSVRQWVEELVPAVVDHGARGFIFRSAHGDRAKAGARWAREIVPAVREAIAGKA